MPIAGNYTDASNMAGAHAGHHNALAGMYNALVPFYISGRWYDSRLLSSSGGTGALVVSAVTLVPLPILATVSYDRFGLLTASSSPGTAGNTVRVGLYTTSATTGLPQTLVFDGGTNSLTAINTTYEWVGSGTLDPGIYWAAVSVGSVAAGNVTFSGANGVPMPYGGYSPGTVPQILRVTGDGTLPASMPTTLAGYTTTFGPGVNFPAISFRVA